MLSIVVIVSTDVIPRATLAAVDSLGIQKLIHDIMTIRAHGEYRCRKKYPVLLSSLKTAVRPDQFPVEKDISSLNQARVFTGRNVIYRETYHTVPNVSEVIFTVKRNNRGFETIELYTAQKKLRTSAHGLNISSIHF